MARLPSLHGTDHAAVQIAPTLRRCPSLIVRARPGFELVQRRVLVKDPVTCWPSASAPGASLPVPAAPSRPGAVRGAIALVCAACLSCIVPAWPSNGALTAAAATAMKRKVEKCFMRILVATVGVQHPGQPDFRQAGSNSNERSGGAHALGWFRYFDKEILKLVQRNFIQRNSILWTSVRLWLNRHRPSLQTCADKSRRRRGPSTGSWLPASAVRINATILALTGAVRPIEAASMTMAPLR